MRRLLIFLFLLLAACTADDVVEEGVETAVSTTPPLAANPTVEPTLTPSPTTTPMPTETSPPTKIPTLTPPPTLIPTATPRTPAVNLVWSDQGDGLIQLSGASDGFRTPNYCDEGSFRWLDDTHLLLLPVTAYTEWYENPEGGLVTQPAVLEVTTGQMWTTRQPPTDICNLPVWSDALSSLIETTGDTVLLHALNGDELASYPGGNPLHLAPSGLRLLAGQNWIDLESGEVREIPITELNRLRRPAWTAGETRFFDCCLRYGDAEAGTYYQQWEMPGLFVSGIGVGPDYDGSSSRWLLDDQYVMSDGGAVFLMREDGQDVMALDAPTPLFLPLIDPVNLTFLDLGEQFGLTQTGECQLARSIRPNQDQIILSYWNWEACPAEVTLLDLPSMTAETVAGFHFAGWSPNGRYALLHPGGEETAVSLLDPDTVTISRLPDLPPFAGNPLLVWSPDEGQLALVGDDKTNLSITRLDTMTTQTYTLPQPIVELAAHPKGEQVAVLLADGSVWLAGGGGETAVSLTDPLPSAHSLRWSPDGTYLAFIGENDLLVLDVMPE